MASSDGIYHTTKKKSACSEYFVKEPRYHPNGFTVYKVISRVPDPSSLDCFKESFVWKRYSDFRDLYTCLATLHRKLYLDGKVPVFAKPKLFGRFDDDVIEERKKSAELVLKFATEHPALLRSAVFKEFFQGLQPVDSTSEIKYLKQAPLKPNVSKERKSLESDLEDLNLAEERLQSGISGQDLEVFDPFYSRKDFIDSTSKDQDETWINQIKQSFSNSRATEVEISSDTGETYHPRELDSDDETELLKALEVSIGQVDLQSYHKRLREQADQNSSRASDDTQISITVNSGNKKLTAMDLEGLYQDETARDKHRKSSKASAYLEAVIKQNKLNTEGSKSSECPLTTEEKVGSLRSPKSGLATTSSLLDLPKMLGIDGTDDDSSGGYVIQAAQQISFARSAESKLSHEEAFGHYKAAISTLLQGVQADTNEKRVQAVRKKTANYLQRAEDIYSCYLKSDTGSTQDFGKPDVKSSSPRPQSLPATDIQRTSQDNTSSANGGSPRHNSKELAAYKVLGTIGKILLVMDTRCNETYAMKILAKSSKMRIRKGVIPTNVPYMVRLHRYYSTDQAVFLVMERASGGKLWDQLQPYFDRCKSKESNSTTQKITAGNLMKSKIELTSTPKKEGSDLDQDAVDESTQSQSFLDVCMEYKTETASQSNVDGEKITEVSKGEAANPSKPIPVQRTWSYLSWDDPIADSEETKQSDEAQTYDVFGDNVNISALPEANAETLSDFKRISSQGNLKLFTIDPDEDNDASFPSMDNCDSHSNCDVSEELDDKTDQKCLFPQELLSEQDLSAVSLISAEDDETILNDQGPELRSANLSLSRILHESKSSPSLSMNSSFEEDRRKNESEKNTFTRIVDENGVSSVDAKTLFRTHSRTKSTASTETKTLEKPDIVKDIVNEEDEYQPVNNKIHSIFIGLDKAKKNCMVFRIPEYTVQRWAAEMIIAVGTLHSVSILCRDLNPDNILLSEDGHIRLSYFGKWRQVERKSCDRKAVRQLYVAPEMTQVHEKKTEACDWWSIGAILYELLTGRPLREAHPAGINSHTILTLPDHLSLEAKSLLTGLLQYFPTQRLGYGVTGLDDIMTHSFFNDTEWDILIEECSSS